jgi:hypothetical protein
MGGWPGCFGAGVRMAGVAVRSLGATLTNECNRQANAERAPSASLSAWPLGLLTRCPADFALVQQQAGNFRRTWNPQDQEGTTQKETSG